MEPNENQELTPEQKAEKEGLDRIVQNIIDHVKMGELLDDALPETFGLKAPRSLTVTNYHDKPYAKKSHIGGEEFHMINARIGSRGSVIIVFKPAITEDYGHMEMPMSEALEHLAGFASLMDDLGVRAITREVATVKKQARDAKAIETHSKDYSEFGTW